ncbi:MAG: hypothetical protein O6857_04570 [Nitrospinae bacterium]|nr:hypothetical protein [Nitrospinota bacterium]
MKRLFKYSWVALFAVAIYGAGFMVSWDMGPQGTVSVAEATHDASVNPGKGHGGGGGGPPTVAELPVQYMVAGGVALILVCGGIVFFMRYRNKKPSPEV